MNKIMVDNLKFSYNNHEENKYVLKDINISILKGEFVSIIGSSGCGKTTLLNLLAGIIFPLEGSITIDGEPVVGTGSNRGVVFQHYSLFPWMNVKQNIVFGIKQVERTRGKDYIEKLAEKYLELVGLKYCCSMYPKHMSNGMQQRVAIARAFAMNPEILLLDEPFSALDVKNRVILQDLLLQLWESENAKKTIVLVTHDIDEAIFLSDRIIVLSERGRIEKDFKIDFNRPRNRKELMRSQKCFELRNDLVSILDNSNSLGT